MEGRMEDTKEKRFGKNGRRVPSGSRRVLKVNGNDGRKVKMKEGRMERRKGEKKEGRREGRKEREEIRKDGRQEGSMAERKGGSFGGRKITTEKRVLV